MVLFKGGPPAASEARLSPPNRRDSLSDQLPRGGSRPVPCLDRSNLVNSRRLGRSTLIAPSTRPSRGDDMAKKPRGWTRREFLRDTTVAAAAAALSGTLPAAALAQAAK